MAFSDERDIRDSEARYRTLFDCIDEGFCVIEFLDGPHGPLSDYIHVEANAAYAINAGIPNVVGQRVREMVPDEADGWVKRYVEVLKTGQPIRFEQELVATGQGTGLGLSMVYGFARQSNGHVRIYSEVGKGTMVCIYLPRYLGEEDLEEASRATAELHPASDAVVLVVDDEPTVRMLITDALGDLNYTCTEAADGPSALAILQSSRPIDLLITDVGLPGGLNGRQVADAALMLRSDLKVLFITGYAENAAFNHGHIGPGMELLTKPFAIEDLGRRVERMLRRNN